MSENENINNENPEQGGVQYEHEVGCTCGCNPETFEQYKKQMISKIIISAVFFAAGYIFSEFTKAPEFVIYSSWLWHCA